MADTAYGGSDSRRWWALAVLSSAQLMIFLDATVVNVALPTLERELHFSQAALAWVVNAYLLTFGGLLLVAGRAGDLVGRRRLLIAGVVAFTAASLLCGLAESQGTLIAGRALQGAAGAVIAATGLAMIVTLFSQPHDRARAMGIFSFVASAGGTLGVIFGGVLIQAFGWRAIFLVNLPIGIATAFLAARLVERDTPADGTRRLDAPGAACATAAVMLFLFGCLSANSNGWGSSITVALLVAGCAVAALFVVAERATDEPLVPLALIRERAVATANTLAVLLRAALFCWFFFAALYMERVLAFTPLETGLGFLPGTLSIGALAYKATPKLVGRVGTRLPFVAGASLVALGLGAFALAPPAGTYLRDVLPGMVHVGVGGGLLFMPLILAATTAAGREHAGVASALLNTSQQLGGALGLAVLATLAAAHTRGLIANGHGAVSALNAGFSLAFIASAGLALGAAVLGGLLLPARPEGAGAARSTRRRRKSRWT